MREEEVIKIRELILEELGKNPDMDTELNLNLAGSCYDICDYEGAKEILEELHVFDKTVTFLLNIYNGSSTILIEIPEISARHAIQKIKTDNNYHFYDGRNSTSIKFNKDKKGWNVIASSRDFSITIDVDKKYLIAMLHDYSNPVRLIEAQKTKKYALAPTNALLTRPSTQVTFYGKMKR